MVMSEPGINQGYNLGSLGRQTCESSINAMEHVIAYLHTDRNR